MTDFNLLDSSIWIDYFINGDGKGLIENKSQIFSSVISIIEIKNKLSKLKISNLDISKQIKFMKERSTLIDVNEKIADKASDILIEGRLHTSDSIIYATALENDLTLITLDNDFRGLPSAHVLD